MIFGVVGQPFQLPQNSIIDMTSHNVLSNSETIGHEDYIPGGDRLSIDDIGQNISKVKLIECHTPVMASADNKYCFIERHCVRDRDLLYPYMLKTYDYNNTVNTILFLKHIETIKEAYFDGVQNPHENPIAYILSTLLKYHNSVSEFERISEMLRHYDGVTNTVFEDSDYHYYNLEGYLDDFKMMARNTFHDKYSSDIIIPMIVPSILGEATLDNTTVRCLQEPLSKQYVHNASSSTRYIDLKCDSVSINPDIPCDYNMSIVPYSSLYYMYRLIFDSIITDLDVTFMENKVSIKYLYCRYPRKKEVDTTIINNLGKLLHSELRNKSVGADAIKVIRNFKDEVLFVYLKNGKPIFQRYWDIALSALCSNNMIVWP